MTVPFLEIDHVDRVFPLPDGDVYIALKNVSVQIKEGEFVSLIGHSGCGKSTLLNMVAGLDNPSQGGVVLEGKQITEPGPDRMVVFQNYSLLPWKTVRQNIALGVDTVLKHLSKDERHAIVEEYINLVGLRRAADKHPEQLSGGMKQRVAIARALALRPKVLLLDEPFGALDALTRGGLQEQLMRICEESKVTCIMVTHDVDEALLLSDRMIMLTTGPAARIGQVLEVPIPRPRSRMTVVNHPNYYALRGEMVYFLEQQKRAKKRKETHGLAVKGNGLEKINLDLGFIPLTDCAPLVVAKEKGFFAKYGLEQVTLSRKPNWKILGNELANGELDAAQMLTGMPLAITLGWGDRAPVPICTAMTLSRNGNAITWSKKLYDEGVTDLATFKNLIQRDRDNVHTFGMVHPTSMHNLILRYWLASGGIHPDNDVSLITIPPALMVSNLKAGNLDGYCVGEPWNTQAILDGTGVAIATDLELFPGHTEKVLGVREEWATKYPRTHVALVKALIEACEYCDDRRNRPEILEWLGKDQYVGAAAKYMRPGFLDAYDRGLGTAPEPLWRFNQFYVDRANCPDLVHSLWTLAQMARWGLVPFPRNWVELLERINRLDVFGEAARDLDLIDTGRDLVPLKLFDGTVFDPNAPIDYLDKLKIKGNVRVSEIRMDQIFSCSMPIEA